MYFTTSQINSFKRQGFTKFVIGFTGWVASVSNTSYFMKTDIGYFLYNSDDSQMKSVKFWRVEAGVRMNINEDVSVLFSDIRKGNGADDKCRLRICGAYSGTLNCKYGGCQMTSFRLWVAK